MKKLFISVFLAFGVGVSANANDYYFEQLQSMGHPSYQPTTSVNVRRSTIKKDIILNEEMASYISINKYLNFLDIQQDLLSDTCEISQRSSTMKQICHSSSKKLSQLYSDFSKDDLTQKEFVLLENKYNRLENKISKTIDQEISTLDRTIRNSI